MSGIIKRIIKSGYTLYRFIILLKNNIINNLYLHYNNVNIKKPYKIKGVISISNKGSLEIQSNFRVNSGIHYNRIGGDAITRLIVKENGNLVIGNNLSISNSTIVCTNKIEIGKFVFIGGDCKIWDTNFHSIEFQKRIQNDDNPRTAPIKIKDNVFIGASSIILKGITIGKNSIIAAGSVVVKDIPDNEVWGGNPAKKIKDL
jgi:acetyltransferase-like isoleucine patch superfamily enzyme